jgi:hypothetical protein
MGERGQRVCSPIMLAHREAAPAHYPPLLQLRQQPRRLRWRPGHFEIAFERRLRNPVPLDLVDQRSALQAKFGGCTIPSSDYSAGCLKRVQNQGASGIHQSSWSRDDAEMLRSCGQQRIPSRTNG